MYIVCKSKCMFIFVCVEAWAYMQTHVWKSEINSQVPFLRCQASYLLLCSHVYGCFACLSVCA